MCHFSSISRPIESSPVSRDCRRYQAVPVLGHPIAFLLLAIQLDMYRKFLPLGKFFIPSPFESLLAPLDSCWIGFHRSLGGDRLLSVLLPFHTLGVVFHPDQCLFHGRTLYQILW